MWAIASKEFRGFFSSLTGYVAGITFLLLTGLMIWVLPGAGNVLDSGQASLSQLFSIAPWLFLFLVPAVTMRMLAEERKEGTLELLLTRPVSEWQIILAKYLAALALIIVIMLPTLIYFLSIYLLGEPRGSIDSGATWGSYLGLLLLAAVYAAIGLCTSALTSNPIVAFVLAALLSLVCYIGFESLALLPIFKGNEHAIATLGIEEHYRSIRRGVVDSRDIVYFASLIALALAVAQTALKRKRR